MSHFCLLRDPDKYVAHDWDFSADQAERTHWFSHFREHFELMLEHAANVYGRKASKQIGQARERFTTQLDQIEADPSAGRDGKLNIMELCRLRDETLRQCGLADPFLHVKARENAAAAELYPEVIAKLHGMAGSQRWLRLIQCVFAGNIFDLGSKATMHLASEPMDFLAVVEQVKQRPWLVDDYDRLGEDLHPAPPTKWSKAVVFVDNAGSDFILGVMPLVRRLALYGTSIVLAANELPSLNDVTADETVEVLNQLAAVDDDLAALIDAGMFEVVSTGNALPLIDLADVSDELNAAAADADCVILIGMGRAVESNFDAAFNVDSLQLAVLKDPAVADRVGGEVYDCICKYRPTAE